jgi:hypothetical protein
MTEDMTTAEVVAGLERERARLLAAVDAMGERATTVFVTEPDGWTTQDVVGHLIHYAGQIAFALGGRVVPPPYLFEVTTRISGQEWNDRAVDYWRGFELDAVRAEFVGVTDSLIEQAGRRTDEQMVEVGTIDWAGDMPLWRFIGADTFLVEWPAHAAQIEAANGAVSGAG